MDGFEVFHPDRLAGRILGMGDVLTLVEKAQQAVDQQQAVEMQRKLRTASFDLNDFMVQMQQIRQMGSLDQLMEMIPGMNQLAKRLPAGSLDEGQFKQVEAIISSMTLEERRVPNMINGSRRRRISRGSGTTSAGGKPTPEPVPTSPEDDEESLAWQGSKGSHGNVQLAGGVTVVSLGRATIFSK